MYIDTHLDVLFHMKTNFRPFSPSSTSGHVDLSRARQGGLLAGFFVVFPTENHFYIDEGVQRWLDLVHNPKNSLEGIFSINSLDDLIKRNISENDTSERNIGAIMHFEGAAGIDSALNRLYIFYECGLRSMSLTWNESNLFATGAGGQKDRGLTMEGKDLLSTLEDLGVLIDVSHLNDKSFWQVISHTNKPVIASHSNLRKFADHKRNLTNEMVLEIAKTGGSVGINFCEGFLSTKETHKANKFCAMEMVREIVSLSENTNSVHIGSDFDGCTVPEDVKDISTMTKFFQELQERLNLSEEDLMNIQFQNIRKILERVWK